MLREERERETTDQNIESNQGKTLELITSQSSHLDRVKLLAARLHFFVVVNNQRASERKLCLYLESFEARMMSGFGTRRELQ